MKPNLRIDSIDQLRSHELQMLLDILNKGAVEPFALLVGGCVRNLILNKPINDIDIATKHTPEQVLNLLKQANIKAIPTGIEHGTVTAVVDDKFFEITTLRHDVRTDGRHADVEFTDDWLEDAKRRDFTINAMFADLDGNIYDPLTQGLEDIKVPTIRFVGDAEKRIREDYLRLLRFFRFHAQYGLGEMDEAALLACSKNAHHLSSLSKERITQELLKIFAVKAPSIVLGVMESNDVLSHLINDLEGLQIFSEYQLAFETMDLMARLSFMADNIDSALSLSNNQKRELKHYKANGTVYDSERSIKKLVYFYGGHKALNLYLIYCTRFKKEPNQEWGMLTRDWQAPQFNITGEDLIKQGYKPGKELGIKLQELEDEWLESVL